MSTLGADPKLIEDTAGDVARLKTEFSNAYTRFYELCNEKLSATNNGKAIFFGDKAGATLSTLEQKKPHFEDICTILNNMDTSLSAQATNIRQFNS